MTEQLVDFCQCCKGPHQYDKCPKPIVEVGINRFVQGGSDGKFCPYCDLTNNTHLKITGGNHKYPDNCTYRNPQLILTGDVKNPLWRTSDGACYVQSGTTGPHVKTRLTSDAVTKVTKFVTNMLTQGLKEREEREAANKPSYTATTSTKPTPYGQINTGTGEIIWNQDRTRGTPQNPYIIARPISEVGLIPYLIDMRNQNIANANYAADTWDDHPDD